MWANHSAGRAFRTRSEKLVLSSWVVVLVVFTVPKGLPVYYVSSPGEESLSVGVCISVLNSDLSGP